MSGSWLNRFNKRALLVIILAPLYLGQMRLFETVGTGVPDDLVGFYTIGVWMMLLYVAYPALIVAARKVGNYVNGRWGEPA